MLRAWCDISLNYGHAARERYHPKILELLPWTQNFDGFKPRIRVIRLLERDTILCRLKCKIISLAKENGWGALRR